jgi:hypothetical protein
MIRRAAPTEAELLTALALRSKAVWGYSAAFMERCRPLLTLTPAYIETYPTFVAVEDGISGFYSLKPRGSSICCLSNLRVSAVVSEPGSWSTRGSTRQRSATGGS